MAGSVKFIHFWWLHVRWRKARRLMHIVNDDQVELSSQGSPSEDRRGVGCSARINLDA